MILYACVCDVILISIHISFYSRKNVKFKIWDVLSDFLKNIF